MTWTTSVIEFCSGVYFVLYTAGVVSSEYVHYKAASCIRWLSGKKLDQDHSVASEEDKPVRRSNDLFVTMVKNIAKRLSKKNVYYTKLFQAIAYGSDVYDDALASFFIQYTDTVEYDRSEYSNQYLNKVIQYATEIGYSLTIDNDNDNVDEYTPSKTGSVSLIFYGTLEKKDASGGSKTPVVIKYLRANMTERIKRSINDFRYMVALLNLFPQFKHLHLNDIFNEQRVMMLDQVNFHSEVENILKMYRNYERTNTTFIKIPVVYPEFTHKFEDIIVMERISGKKLEDLTYEEKDEYCGIVAKGLIKSVFLDGFYHCDMHPGNLLFMDCETESSCKRVGIFDFGIMSDISVREQNLSFELFKHILRRNVVEAAQTIVSDYTEPHHASKKRKNHDVEIDRSQLHREIEELVAEVLKDSQVTCFSAKDLSRLNYALLKYNLKVSGALTKFEISLSVCDNLCKKLAAHRSYMSYLKDLVDDMFE
jgi:predicted unusual protein kinase regulating ubiquinone biosynthesis (AarF/ABC1/UbiB family)